MNFKALISMSVCTCLCLVTSAQAAVFDVANAEEDTKVGALHRGERTGMTDYAAVPNEVKFDDQGHMLIAGMVGLQNQELLSTAGNETGNENDPGTIRLVRTVGGGGGAESVPEPSSLVLLGVASAGLGWYRRGRQRRATECDEEL